MMRASWPSSLAILLAALPGVAAPGSQEHVHHVDLGAVAVFADVDDAAAEAGGMIPDGVASFPDVPMTPEMVQAARALALLARNPYSDMLATAPASELALENPYAAARLDRELGSLESNPYQFDRRLANPYTDDLRVANPYTEELRLQNPYTALRR